MHTFPTKGQRTLFLSRWMSCFCAASISSPCCPKWSASTARNSFQKFSTNPGRRANVATRQPRDFFFFQKIEMLMDRYSIRKFLNRLTMGVDGGGGGELDSNWMTRVYKIRWQAVLSTEQITSFNLCCCCCCCRRHFWRAMNTPVCRDKESS